MDHFVKISKNYLRTKYLILLFTFIKDDQKKEKLKKKRIGL